MGKKKREREKQEADFNAGLKSVPLLDVAGRIDHAAAFGPITHNEDLSDEHSLSQKSDQEVSSDSDANDEDENEFDLEQAVHNRRNLVQTEADLVERLFESVFYFKEFQNLEAQSQNYFYVITFGNEVSTRQLSGPLRRRTMYTSSYHLVAGQFLPLAVPLVIWDKKQLPVSYKDLKNFGVNIELWKNNEASFNELYASLHLNFMEVIEMEPDTTLILTKQVDDSTKLEVHRIRVLLQLAQVFDFDLFFESWWYTPSSNIIHRTQGNPLVLYFEIPPAQGEDLKKYKTHDTSEYWWNCNVTANFRGTIQQLENSYFIVGVYGHIEGKFQLIGKCIMSLKIVTSYPFFKGVLKYFDPRTDQFIRGEISGNIKCLMKSVGMNEYEDPKSKRPVQKTTAAMINQLDLDEQYLVIRLFKCENLPAAKLETGTSDAIVKMKWDGIVNTAPVRLSTCRPAWNQNFYFPIRLIDDNERDIEYIHTIMPLDVASKGPIIFEVWDVDEVSSDFLGGCEVHLSKYTSAPYEERALADIGTQGKEKLPDGRPAQFTNAEPLEQEEHANDDEDEEIIHELHNTHVYKGEGIELTETSFIGSSSTKPRIYFEIYVIPPFHPDFKIPDPPKQLDDAKYWSSLGKRWNEDFASYTLSSREWFPQSPINRRFTCVADHPNAKKVVPLTLFLTNLSVLEEIVNHGKLLHWISNMTFQYTPAQIRTGEIQRWFAPNYMLITRKGTIADHALLLCSCLLGMGYDAYVCKGTIESNTAEHCWVMSRHADYSVVFWETATRMKYCLPYRWGMYEQEPPAAFDYNNYYQGDYLQQWYEYGQGLLDHQEPENINTDELLYGTDVLPDVKIDPSNLVEKVNNNERGAQIRDLLKDKLENLPISPVGFLLDPESTLVYVPYSTIEVVFNNKQLYGNLQNHHPACILYDLEDERRWRPFVIKEVQPIESDIYISPMTSTFVCEALASDIQETLEENIRLTRNTKGYDTQIDMNEVLHELLLKYLDLLEYRMNLDRSMDPGPPGGHTGWSAWTNFSDLGGAREEHDDWTEHFETIREGEGDEEDWEEEREEEAYDALSYHGRGYESESESEVYVNKGKPRLLASLNKKFLKKDVIKENITNIKKDEIKHRMFQIDDYGDLKEDFTANVHDELQDYAYTEGYGEGGYGEGGYGEYGYGYGDEWGEKGGYNEAAEETLAEYKKRLEAAAAKQKQEEEEAMEGEKGEEDDNFGLDDITRPLAVRSKKFDREQALQAQEETTDVIEGEAKPPRKFIPEILSEAERDDQLAKWSYYYRMEQTYFDLQNKISVRNNHTFCGFPLHVSTTDISEIRTFIIRTTRFKKIIQIPIDNVVYVIAVKAFPLVGGVVSTWIFIGAEIPITKRNLHLRKKTK